MFPSLLTKPPAGVIQAPNTIGAPTPVNAWLGTPPTQPTIGATGTSTKTPGGATGPTGVAKWVPDSSPGGGHWVDGAGNRIAQPDPSLTPQQILAQNPGIDPSKLSYRDPPGGLVSDPIGAAFEGIGADNHPGVAVDRQGFTIDAQGNRTTDPAKYVSTKLGSFVANSDAQNKARAGGAAPNPDAGAIGPGSPSDLLKQYSTFAPRTAPQATAPTIGAPPQISGPAVGPTALATPGTVGSAAMVAPTQVGGVADATAARVAPVANITAPTIGTVTNANAERATAAQVDGGQQDQIRQRELSLLDMLTQAAQGNGPSAAQAQFQKALDQAIATQQGMAAGAHGTGRVGAELRAGQNIGTLTGQGAADAAALRAKEMQDARTALLSGLESTRGADLSLATSNAGFQQGANLQNASLGTQVNMANAQAANTRDIQNANNILEALKSNQTTAAQLNISQAQLTNAVALANADARNKLTQLQAQITSQEGIANAAQQNEMQRLQAQLDSNSSIANANNINAAQLKTAELEATARITNANNTTQTNIAGAQLNTQVAIANTKSKIDQLQLDDQAKAELLHAATTGSVAALSAATQLKIAQLVASTATSAANKQLIASIVGNVVGGVATTGGALISHGAFNGSDSSGGSDTGGTPSTGGGSSSPGDFTGDDG